MADLCIPTACAMSVSVTRRMPSAALSRVAASMIDCSRCCLAWAERARWNSGVVTPQSYCNGVA